MDPRKLIKFKGFLDRFYYHLSQKGVLTHMEAYMLTEAEHEAFMGAYKYSDYYSFKSMKSKYLKALKNTK